MHLRRKLEYLLENLQFSLAVQNPFSYLVARGLRATPRIELSGGATVPSGSLGATTIRTLVALAYNGAHFVQKRSGAPQEWLLDIPRGYLETPLGLRFSLDSVSYPIFSETFIYDIHYQGPDLLGKIVFDVGANVGDTALYYASQGAEVFAFEPDPINFELLRRNVSLNNGLSSRIHLRQFAIGHSGRSTFHAGLGGASGALEDRGTVIEVESLDLAGAFDQAGVSNAFLLKADCKGCEYQIVQQREISQFERVSVEYAPISGLGDLKFLMERLRQAGFGRFRVFKHNGDSYSTAHRGIIEATRIEEVERVDKSGRVPISHPDKPSRSAR